MSLIKLKITIIGFVFFCSTLTFSGVEKKTGFDSKEMDLLHNKIVHAENELLVHLKNNGEAKIKVKKIKTLLGLLNKEKKLADQRLKTLENFVIELEKRKQQIKKRIISQQDKLRTFLKTLYHSSTVKPDSFELLDQEQNEVPMRRMLSKMVLVGNKRLERLMTDLLDADALDEQIVEEREQIAYFFQDLQERKSLLEFHKKLQNEVLRKKFQKQVTQLEKYSKLKSSERKVKKLIHDFNSKIESEKIESSHQEVTQAMLDGSFVQLKGRLFFPVKGKVITQFGKKFDSQLKLNVFKKGIEIAPVDSKAKVKAVFGGKIVFSGNLPHYGRVAIVDHGANYYTLSAHMGELLIKEGEIVLPGQELGLVNKNGTPFYFEVRSKNVAVNPLKWLEF